MKHGPSEEGACTKLEYQLTINKLHSIYDVLKQDRIDQHMQHVTQIFRVCRCLQFHVIQGAYMKHGPSQEVACTKLDYQLTINRLHSMYDVQVTDIGIHTALQQPAIKMLLHNKIYI